MEPTACPECDVIQRAGTAFCSNCGVRLIGKEPAAAPGETSRTAAFERARARQEFGRIKRIVTTVRSVFWATAVFALLLVVLWHLVLSPRWPAENWWLAVTLLVWGQLAVTVAGALLVTRAPLVWTTVGACWWTLDTALNVALAGLPPINLVRILLTASFWFAVAQAARVQRLMAADPSLQLVRKRLDPERRVAGGIADTAQQRRRAERRRSGVRTLALAGVAVVGVVLLVVVVRQVTRAPSVDATAQAFAERWAARDAEALGQLFVEGPAGRRAIALRDDVERRGWHERAPRLGEAEIEASEAAALARFPCGDGALTVAFGYDERVGWKVVQVTLPPFDLPELAPSIDAFRQAWAAEGTDALLACFRPASRDRIGAQLVRLLEKRDWHERRPALGDVDAGEPGRERRRVLFAIGFDELGVTFEYWHPSWRVVGVTLPRE